MPLSNTLLNEKTVTREQLAFDVTGAVSTDISAIGTGGLGVQGVQGAQGAQGTQGVQGVQGVQGAYYIGAQGTQGQSVYIGSQGFLASTPNVVYNNTAGNDQVFIGQQGAAVNYTPVVVTANDTQNNFASYALELRHALSNPALSGTTGIGTRIMFAAQTGGTGSMTNLANIRAVREASSQNSLTLEAFFPSNTNASPLFKLSPNLIEQRTNTSTLNNFTEISKATLLTADTSSPTAGFGAAQSIFLQTGAGSTGQYAAQHKYQLVNATEATRKTRYTLTVFDKILNSTTPDFDTIETEAPQTIFTSWSASPTLRSTGFIFNTDMATAGVPSGSFGTVIELQAKSDTTGSRTLSAIESYWTTFADASRTSELQLKTVRNGSLAHGITLSGHATQGSKFATRLNTFYSGTNAGLVLSPKGDGFFKAGEIPDGTTANGNSPGTYAVDLGLGTKTNANQVAGANYSAILGGTQHSIGTANTYSAIVGGLNSTIQGTATSAIVLGGQYHTINTGANNSVALGGNNHSINGQASVAMGENNITTHSNSVVMGRAGDSQGKNTFNLSGGTFASLYADATSFQAVLRGQTTNTATPLNLANDGDAFYAHPDNTSISWDIQVIAKTATNPATTNSYFMRCGTERQAGGNVVLIGAVNSFEQEENGAWNADMVVDGTNLRVQVTGTAFQTIRWVAHVRATVVRY